MTGGERLRLFVAASVPCDVLDAAEAAVAPLEESFPGARWVDIANQHVTLKFLGWAPASQLDAIVAACGSAVSAHEGAQLTLGELGAFPSRTRVRVLWLGVEDPSGLLARLAAALDRALEPFGFPVEARAFTPHLTLARFKVPFRPRGGWPELRLDGPAWDVDRVALWRSHLSSKGARYEPVAHLPLAT